MHIRKKLPNHSIYYCIKYIRFTHGGTSSSLWRCLLPALAGVLMFSTGVLRWGRWLVMLKVGDRRPGTNTLLTWGAAKTGKTKKVIFDCCLHYVLCQTAVTDLVLPWWLLCREPDCHRPPEPAWHLYSEDESLTVRKILKHQDWNQQVILLLINVPSFSVFHYQDPSGFQQVACHFGVLTTKTQISFKTTILYEGYQITLHFIHKIRKQKNK